MSEQNEQNVPHIVPGLPVPARGQIIDVAQEGRGGNPGEALDELMEVLTLLRSRARGHGCQITAGHWAITSPPGATPVVALMHCQVSREPAELPPPRQTERPPEYDRLLPIDGDTPLTPENSGLRPDYNEAEFFRNDDAGLEVIEAQYRATDRLLTRLGRDAVEMPLTPVTDARRRAELVNRMLLGMAQVLRVHHRLFHFAPITGDDD